MQSTTPNKTHTHTRPQINWLGSAMDFVDRDEPVLKFFFRADSQDDEGVDSPEGYWVAEDVVVNKDDLQEKFVKQEDELSESEGTGGEEEDGLGEAEDEMGEVGNELGEVESAILHLTNDTRTRTLLKMFPIGHGFMYTAPSSPNCIAHPHFIHYSTEPCQTIEPRVVQGAIVEDMKYFTIGIRHIELMRDSTLIVGAGCHDEEQLYIFCPPGRSVRVRVVWCQDVDVTQSWLLR